MERATKLLVTSWHKYLRMGGILRKRLNITLELVITETQFDFARYLQCLTFIEKCVLMGVLGSLAANKIIIFRSNVVDGCARIVLGQNCIHL